MGKNRRTNKNIKGEIIMEYRYYKNEVMAYDGNRLVGDVTFPEGEPGVVELNSIFVVDEYQGRGIANQLMLEVIKYLEERKKVAMILCPFAEKWFSKHPEYSKYVMK